MKVWALRNPNGTFRGSFHRRDAIDCPGRRRGEEDRDDYALVELVDLPARMPACHHPPCFELAKQTAGDFPGHPGGLGSAAAAHIIGGDAVVSRAPQERARRKADPDEVALGSRVRLLDLDSGQSLSRTIVANGARAANEEVSSASPIGSKLLESRVGDTVVAGSKRLKIEAVEQHPQRTEVRP